MHRTDGEEQTVVDVAEDGYPVSHLVALMERIPGKRAYLIGIAAGRIALRAVHSGTTVITCGALGRKSTLHTPPPGTRYSEVPELLRRWPRVSWA